MSSKWARTLILGILAAAGVWLWLGFQDRVQVLGALGLALTGVVGVPSYLRIRANRRWRAALDVYAERVLAEHKRQQRIERRTVDFSRPNGAHAISNRLPTHRNGSHFRTKEGLSHAGAQS
jgi:hypothetical protein